MNVQSPSIQSPDGERPESAARRIRVRRRFTPAPAPRRDEVAASAAASADRPDTTRPVGGVGEARILRRWSVADLIARAGGAPRAIA
jgi:hypothetical protein